MAREGTCPAGIESSSRRFDGGLQNGILAFQPPWYPTEPPRALRRATQARWVASARTTSGSIRVFRWMFRVDSSHTTKIALGRTRNSWGAPLSLAQMEHVRAPTFGDALRATKTHPIMPDTLGVRVVTVLGPLVSRWPPRGVASSGTRESNRSLCALSVLGVLGWLS